MTCIVIGLCLCVFSGNYYNCKTMPVCKGKITPSIFGATGAVIKI